MGYVTLITELLKAIPQLLKLIQSAWNSARQMREQSLIDETKKAVLDGDTKKVEENLGNPSAGKPSGLAGVVPGSAKKN